MTSDDTLKRFDPRGYIPGPGSQISRMCDKCRTPKSTAGGKRYRVWWHCKECAK